MREAAAAPAKADWNAIRSWFTRANKLDSENAEPLMLFYESFVMAGARPTPNAVDALLYAVALAPQDEVLRVTAVRQLLIDNRLADARELFAPVAFNPHANEARRAATGKIMAAMSGGDAKAALMLLDERPQENAAARPGKKKKS